jgi:hypothetical protein
MNERKDKMNIRNDFNDEYKLTIRLKRKERLLLHILAEKHNCASLTSFMKDIIYGRIKKL